MAELCYRKMVSIFIIITVIKMVKPHISSSSSEISGEDSKVRKNRRSDAREAYGLPIEFPIERENEIVQPAPLLRRKADGGIRPVTTTTTPRPIYPPLDRRSRRIYNPDEVAQIENFPFMAALLVNGELWCGGVIIDKDKVLTAAHCLQLQYNNRFFREYVKMLTVRVGSTNATAGGEILRVSEIFFHPNYKPQTLEFNYAVVRLHRNLTFGKQDSFISPIAYSSDKTVPVDNEIYFLGWGSVLAISGSGGEVLLQKVKLPVYDIADCQEIYGKELVTRTNFCAGYITLPKNVCNHDAGGPAILGDTLVGILSFSAKRCDQADQPAVFSTVGAVSTWLENLGEKKLQLLNTAIKSPEMAVI